MKKFLQILSILTLMTWGGVFLYFYLTGRVEKHLDPSFRIYALISGVGMLLISGFNFLHRNHAQGHCNHDHAHGEPCGHDDNHRKEHETHDDCGHDHPHGQDQDCGQPHCHDHESHDQAEEGHHHHHEESASGVVFSLLVLLVPFLFATGYSRDQFSSEYLAKWGKIERQMLQMRIAEKNAARPPSISSVDPAANPYTSDAISGENPGEADTPPDREPAAESETEDSWATFTLEDLKQMVPQNDDDEFLLDVPQIFYTAGDRELMEVMEGIPVETTAQLMEETLNNPDNTRLKAFRLFIECCAADARPLSIPVDFGKSPPEYTEMGWYRLHGKLHYVQEAGELLPIIRIEEIEETSEPMDGLLF